MKVLFLCGNSNQSDMFLSLVYDLKSLGVKDIVFLSLDKLKKEKAEIPLQKADVDYQCVESYDRLSPVHILKKIKPFDGSSNLTSVLTHIPIGEGNALKRGFALD